jgi:hypothetical protein
MVQTPNPVEQRAREYYLDVIRRRYEFFGV